MLTILFASVTLHGQVQQINSAVDKIAYVMFGYMLANPRFQLRA
jgi:hypothetical protein